MLYRVSRLVHDDPDLPDFKRSTFDKMANTGKKQHIVGLRRKNANGEGISNKKKLLGLKVTKFSALMKCGLMP